MSAHYYQILGIAENATIEEIKRAFRTRAKDLHPDRNASRMRSNNLSHLPKLMNLPLVSKPTGTSAILLHLKMQKNNDNRNGLKRSGKPRHMHACAMKNSKKQKRFKPSVH
jgi:hypothetical protein